MANNREKILIVENNPEISGFLSNQALKPLGYDIFIESDSAAAIQLAASIEPDVILANIDLPGLSGKDLLIALSSQGIHAPLIIIAGRGMENKVIQAFRLGAIDSLFWPMREAEVVSAVERALTGVRGEREREKLAIQLRSTNEELKQRVSELTALYAVGKAVVSVTNRKLLFDKLVQGAVAVTEADAGWFLQREEDGRSFLLFAHHNIPKNLAANLYKPWDDGVSSMVALSGEPLAIHGEPIRRFKISLLGQSAMVVPVKVKKEVIGLLEVVRKSDQAFTPSNQKLLEAVADYASISIVNARLFQFLEERAQILQNSVDQAQADALIQQALLQRSGQDQQKALSDIQNQLNQVVKNMDQLNLEQQERIRSAQQSVGQMERLLGLVSFPEKVIKTGKQGEFNLNDLVQRCYVRYQPIAKDSQVSMKLELADRPILVHGDPSQLLAALDGLVSNAIKYSQQDGQVILSTDINPENLAVIRIEDTGIGISTSDQVLVFEGNYRPVTVVPQQYYRAAIGLPLIKRIIDLNSGKIWFKSNLGTGSTFYITLPLAH
jgi:K+-sensing histidine kinase KdpD/CheY-like chemotaxis protein